MHIEAGRHCYGGARQVEYLIDGLSQRGVDNVLLCPPEQPLASRLQRAEIIPVPMGGEHDLGMGLRFSRLLAGLDPDVVHVHSRRGADLYGGLAAALARRPAVLTRRVQSHEPKLWARFKYRPYRAIVAISRAVEAELERAGVVSARRCIIPSAVDARRFVPRHDAARRLRQALGLAEHAFVVGLVAQLIPRKGHRLALSVMQRLGARHPNLMLVCFGRGPEEAVLREAVTARGLAGRVVLAGFRDDLASLLSGIDVLIHPASREGLGVAVLEAMSAERPVVAARVGGLVDLIESGHDGVLVPAGDADAFAAAVSDLIAAPERRRRLGQAARARVERDFSVAAMSDAYLDLYRSLRETRRAVLRS